MRSDRFHRGAILAAALSLGAGVLLTDLVLDGGAPRFTAVNAAHAQPQAGSLSDTDARALLGRLAGIWTVVGRSFDGNGQPDSDLSGSAAYNWTLNGLFLAGEQVLTNGREMLHWVDFLGYNQNNQLFSRTLLSDRDPANFCSNGSWDPARRVLTFVTDPIRAADGTERRIRAMLDLSREDQPGWELNYLVGSGATEKLVGTVGLLMTRSTGPSASPGQGAPLAPGQAPGGQGAPGATPGGGTIQRGPMTPAQVQQQLDGVLRQKQQMQQQIEDMRRQMRTMSNTMGEITR